MFPPSAHCLITHWVISHADLWCLVLVVACVVQHFSWAWFIATGHFPREGGGCGLSLRLWERKGCGGGFLEIPSEWRGNFYKWCHAPAPISCGFLGGGEGLWEEGKKADVKKKQKGTEKHS